MNDNNTLSFSTDDLLQFVKKEFGDTRPGVMSHASAVCIANAPLNHPNGYNYLWRTGHAELRLFRPGIDIPNPDRGKDQTQPRREDVPEKYRYLLNIESGRVEKSINRI
jgi:hypothetical protein